MEMGAWTLLFLLLVVSWGNADECPTPNLEDNLVLSDSAILKNNFPDGSDITLECSTGFEVQSGSNVIRCLAGKWSKQELICKKKDCGYPSEIPHVKYEIKSDTLFGSHIKSYCDPGYSLRGSSYRQCLASGWTGRPRCLVVTCGMLPDIPHSTIISQPDKKIPEYQNVIEYGCEKNYTLVGRSTVVCQENGEYSLLPQCKGDCPEPFLEGSVVLKNSATLNNTFPHGSEVTLGCLTGHVKVQGLDVITCNNGEWNKQELSCKGDCPEPFLEGSVVLKNSATLNNTFPHGSEVTLGCLTGHVKIQGLDVITCNNGEWNKQELSCKAITCGNPPEIPHSNKHSNQTKENLEYKDKIEYSCEPKYTLVGNKSVVCQEDGKYSSIPQCKGDCPEPFLEGSVVLKNSATLNNTFPHGSEVTLGCLTGHVKVQGLDVITCNNGEWNKQELSCKGSGFLTDDIKKIVVPVAISVIILCLAVLVCLIVLPKWKNKGSYDTGEEKRMKMGLMEGNSYFYQIPI